MDILVDIDVPELGPAIDFYCTALPLHLNRILDEDTAELTGASATLYLLRHAPGTQPTDNRDELRHYTRHWTPVHIDFVVDDLEEAAKRAIAAGAVQKNEPIQWRGSRFITFADPFGHGFCLIEFREQTYSDEAS